MEYSLKLIREVYGDIFWEVCWGSLSKKRGEAFQRSVGKPLGNPQKIKSGSLKCILGKTWEKHTGKPYAKLQKINSGSLKWFWHKLGRSIVIFAFRLQKSIPLPSRWRGECLVNVFTWSLVCPWSMLRISFIQLM